MYNDKKLFFAVITRAHKLFPTVKKMDLTFCIMDADKLKLFDAKKLNGFDDFNFQHDIAGLYNGWNHKNHSFDATFTPRSCPTDS